MVVNVFRDENGQTIPCLLYTSNQKVAELYEKLYEDNVSGKITDEWFKMCIRDRC